MEEKRKFGRIPFGTIVSVVTDNQPQRGELQDLSLQGAQILLETPSTSAVESPCQLRLPLSSDLILEFGGVIRYFKDKIIGIHFTQTDPESFGHLIRLMELNTGDAEKIHRELHSAD
jgi:hypothetical protein